jgi:hypothetical protein
MISAKQAETQMWEKVSRFIADPDYLLLKPNPR